MASEKIPDCISISFCVSDNYVQHMAVVVASILEHNPGTQFIFHVVQSFISEANRAQLQVWEEASAGRFRFVLHTVDARRFEAFPLPLEHITQEMYYRYLLPELLADEARTIYMDVDVLVLGDLKPLWEVDLCGNALAAAEDIKEHTPEFKAYLQRLGMSPEAHYFNSGVFVMDLNALRAMDFGARCMRNSIEHIHHIAWPDQDVINMTLEGHILALPLRFNCTAPKLLPRGERIVIRHFANFSSKPWCCLWKNRTYLAYAKYLRKTPWRKNLGAFILAHIRGFFWFRYTKKGITRTLCCGILVRKRVNSKESQPRAGLHPEVIVRSVRIICIIIFASMLAEFALGYTTLGVITALLLLALSACPRVRGVFLPRFSKTRPIVLLLHSVNDHNVVPYAPNGSISSKRLEQLIVDLLAMGYTFMTLREAMRASSNQRIAVLTFDDGWEDNFTNLIPILRRRRVPATIFLNNRHEMPFLTERAIREMADTGLIEFGGHFDRHVRMDLLGDDECRAGIASNRRHVQQVTGTVPISFAPPFGLYSSQILKLLQQQGYRYVAIIKPNHAIPACETEEDPVLVQRISLPAGDSSRFKLYMVAVRGRWRI